MANPSPVNSQPSTLSSVPFAPILNTIGLIFALGFLYYTKFIVKHAKITEMGERQRLVELQARPTQPAVPAFIPFESMTLNMKQLQGKPHYLTLKFTLEIHDQNKQDMIQEIRSLILDQLIATVGRKEFYELTTIQERYILRSQMIDFTNELIISHAIKPIKEGLVTNVYFTDIIVQ